MDDQQLYDQIVDRLDFMMDNVEDLTADEKVMQIKMVGEDINKFKDPLMRRKILLNLMGYAVVDLSCHIAFNIFFPKEELDDGT